MAELDARRAEILNNAAKTIQRRIRTHITHKQFIALRKATVAVQSIWRGEQTDDYFLFVISSTSFSAVLGDYVVNSMGGNCYDFPFFACHSSLGHHLIGWPNFLFNIYSSD